MVQCKILLKTKASYFSSATGKTLQSSPSLGGLPVTWLDVTLFHLLWLEFAEHGYEGECTFTRFVKCLVICSSYILYLFFLLISLSLFLQNIDYTWFSSVKTSPAGLFGSIHFLCFIFFPFLFSFSKQGFSV